MSVTHRPDKPDNTAELKKELREVKAAGDSTAALLSLSFGGGGGLSGIHR